MIEITYEDLAAEAVKNWPQIDPKRMARAVSIAQNGAVILARFDEKGEPIRVPNTDAYSVKSEQTRPYASGRTWYTVRPKQKSCNCRDAATGAICKHRLAVWLYTQLPKRQHAEAVKSLEAMKGIQASSTVKVFTDKAMQEAEEAVRKTTPPPARQPQAESLRQLGY